MKVTIDDWLEDFVEDGCSLDDLLKFVKQVRENVLNEILNIKADERLGLGKLSQEEKIAINGFKLYLKHKLKEAK